LRVKLSVFEPPWKVGVAPSTLPEGEATVRLCSSEAVFVKAMLTLPAFADSEVVSNFKRPSVFAARASAFPSPELVVGVEGVGELVVAVVAGVLAGAGLAELVLLEELPHPDSASRPIARASIERLGSERLLARVAVWKLTSVLPLSISPQLKDTLPVGTFPIALPASAASCTEGIPGRA
jgi:hypothetical protein